MAAASGWPLTDPPDLRQDTCFFVWHSLAQLRDSLPVDFQEDALPTNLAALVAVLGTLGLAPSLSATGTEIGALPPLPLRHLNWCLDGRQTCLPRLWPRPCRMTTRPSASKACARSSPLHCEVSA